jgi:uncharacterized protein (DUF433 family)
MTMWTGIDTGAPFGAVPGLRCWSRHETIDWAECTLVETEPGVQSGSPVLRGDYGLTIAEISEQFEVPPESIRAIVTYAQSHRIAHPV